MSLTLTREALSNQIADDLATRNTNAGLIEGAVNGLESAESAIKGTGWTDENLVDHEERLDTLEADDATAGSVAYDIKQSSDALKGVGYTEGSLKTHEDRLDTLEGADTVVGSVAKTVKDAVDPVSTELSTVKVKTSENDLAIADIRRDQNLANQSEAKITTSDYGIVVLPKNATGNLKMKREGLTATNIVNGASVAIGGTITFASVLNDIYYDVLHKVQITGTGSDIVVTNDSGAIANMSIINLTQTFSSIPTLAQCKNIFPSYFADTKNVPMTGRYRGRGKNQVNVSDSFTSYTNNGITVTNIGGNQFRLSGTVSSSSANSFVGSLNETVLNGEVTLGVTKISGAITGGLVTFGLKEKSSAFVLAGDTSLATTGVNKIKSETLVSKIVNGLRIYASGGIVFSDVIIKVQVEVGAVATTYVPFEAHDLYLTAPEGRSVPSAKDSVEVQDGKLVHVKRVSTPVAVSSGVAVNVTNYPLAKTGGNFRVELTASDVQIGVIGTDSTSGAGNLTYELATPITTPVDSDGAIPASASVYWEPAIPDVGIYSTKFDILDTDHPIASIDKLYKVDFITGVQTLLTDAVVAGDGLSFTSASLTDGDLVNVIYFYATANPEGLTTATYLNSNVVVADSANGKYYKYKPTITNGAIASWTLTEVV